MLSLTNILRLLIINCCQNSHTSAAASHLRNHAGHRAIPNGPDDAGVLANTTSG
jgi:hypothetical protein